MATTKVPFKQGTEFEAPRLALIAKLNELEGDPDEVKPVVPPSTNSVVVAPSGGNFF